MLSVKEYERLQDVEDQLWVLKANIAAKEGFLTPKESEDFLKDILGSPTKIFQENHISPDILAQ